MTDKTVVGRSGVAKVKKLTSQSCISTSKKLIWSRTKRIYISVKHSAIRHYQLQVLNFRRNWAMSIQLSHDLHLSHCEIMLELWHIVCSNAKNESGTNFTSLTLHLPRFSCYPSIVATRIFFNQRPVEITMYLTHNGLLLTYWKLSGGKCVHQYWEPIIADEKYSMENEGCKWAVDA